MTGVERVESGGLPGEIEPLRTPDAARVFGARAARLRDLAPGDAAAAYLAFLGALAERQQSAVRAVPAPPGGRTLLDEVPLRAAAWPRQGAWRPALDALVRDLAREPVPEATAAALARLRAMPDDEAERIAAAVLTETDPADPAASTFVAAALQVCWTTAAAVVPPELAGAGSGSRCPACASRPAAGLVSGDLPLRYLTCWLCASAWHVPRLTCVHCGLTARLTYLVVQGGAAGVKAEACESCGRYLKLFYLEQRPGAEAIADDVATLALDVLVAGEGFVRAGANPFLLAPAAAFGR